MKAVIFCGGPGTRMWPISRKAKPKQLEKIFGTKSTAQLAFDRIRPIFDPKDIYIATSREYQEMVERDFPEIPRENFFYEPAIRDVGPAVGYALFRLERLFANEPVAILWSDHFMKNEELFRRVLKEAEKLVLNDPKKIVYIGCRPTFPNANLGWIGLGEKITNVNGIDTHKFESWTYRPPLEKAKEWFAKKTHVWNMGYFMATSKFLVETFQNYAPKLYAGLRKIQQAVGTEEEKKVLEEIYPQLEKISFDDAVVVHIPKDKAIVLAAEIGWSDPGALDGLKEALEKNPGGNVTKGKVVLRKVGDCLVYNETGNLAVAVGVKGLLIVVTKDVVLVCDKESVPEIKKLVKSLEDTDLEKYT